MLSGINYFRIQAQYGSTWGAQHGGSTGTCTTIPLAANEVITSMDVGNIYVTNYYRATMICHIKLYTSIATYGPYKGCNTPQNFLLANGLAYLKGNCGQMIDGLQLVYYN